MTMPDIDRRPAAVAFKTMLLIFSTATALGVVPLPGSLQDTPGAYGQLAAIGIWLGCFISIVGIIYGWRIDLLDGLVVEQVGLAFMAVGSGMYAVALLGVEHPSDAMLALGLSIGTLAFSVTQYLSIRRYRGCRVGKASDG